ncbi:hypothetical protein RRG08_066336 [Elysia crispata]|uniref:VWFA domain-containing protein n=1 Tax=Elysia crispata TaxID=231223 RepID=A0AAE1DWD5_9GAST|nr:hypothetical protein RRG08_066336 [Elysia crispata]
MSTMALAVHMVHTALLVLLALFAVCCRAQTNSTNTTNSAGEFCGVDIVFLVDASGSVGSFNFRKTLDFVESVVNGLNIGPFEVRVGLIRFASSPSLQFHLNTYTDKQSVLSRVSATSYTGGGTDTARGLAYATDVSFTAINGMRSEAAQVAIVVTDGKSNSESATISEATRLKDKIPQPRRCGSETRWVVNWLEVDFEPVNYQSRASGFRWVVNRLEVYFEPVKCQSRASGFRWVVNRLEVGGEPVRVNYQRRGLEFRWVVNRLEVYFEPVNYQSRASGFRWVVNRLEVGGEPVSYHSQGDAAQRQDGWVVNQLEVDFEPVNYQSRASGFRWVVNRSDTTAKAMRLRDKMGSELVRVNYQSRASGFRWVVNRLEVYFEPVKCQSRASGFRWVVNRLEVGGEPVRYHSQGDAAQRQDGRGSGIRCEVNRVRKIHNRRRRGSRVGWASEPFRVTKETWTSDQLALTVSGESPVTSPGRKSRL